MQLQPYLSDAFALHLAHHKLDRAELDPIAHYRTVEPMVQVFFQRTGSISRIEFQSVQTCDIRYAGISV